MEHIRPVISQVGVAMELHGHKRADGASDPVTICLVGVAELDAYKAMLTQSNPDYRYATVGQLAVMYANRLFKDVEVSQCAWTYNASTEEYVRA